MISSPPVDSVTVTRVGLERIDDLAAFWWELHRYQGGLSAPIPGVPLRSDEEANRMGTALYVEWLEQQPDSFAYLAELEGRPVGYLVGLVQEPSEIWETGPIGHIDSFFVNPDLRGQGVGGLLLERAYEHMRGVGVKTVGLDVVATNDAARRLYEREGFVPTLLHMYRALPS